MEDSTLLKERIKRVGGDSAPGRCVLYVMSRDQRVADNHALIAAQKHALAKKLPLAVVFCLLPTVKGRAREHYEYMLSGLSLVEENLLKLNIPFMMLIGRASDTLANVFHHTQPDAVYFDFNPLRGPRELLIDIAGSSPCPVYVVDTHNVVPVWRVSDKKEVGAYTIRPKLHKMLATYLVEPDIVKKHPYIWPGKILSMHSMKEAIEELLLKLPSNGTRLSFLSGEEVAAKHLHHFMATKLERYAVERNDPSSGSQSDLSPYLHFGQISSLRVAIELRRVAQKNGGDLHFISSPKMPKPEEAETTLQHGVDSLIEEMIVRKELADNYCYYEENYDNLLAAPSWARASLDTHRNDQREFLYSYEQLVSAQTHDDAWNAAQRQLTKTGKMHGYMRMYWAKKVLEWTQCPEQAIEYLIKMNDFYSIDGGDPNGYAGILWSVAGVHDRPWFERPIFGVIRYMNYEGLKRKFDIKTYIDTSLTNS